MKVIAINGSPHREGNTYHAIRMVFDELEKEGIETEIIRIGHLPVRSCIACNKCRTDAGRCHAFPDDGVNETLEKLKDADGILLGSPVHYCGITGAMKCFCDRLFYVASGTEDILRHKVGAAVTAVRRAGGITALDTLHKYLQYREMLIASSTYWTTIYGLAPGDAQRDEEGTDVLQILGKNMAWMVKMNNASEVQEPAFQEKRRMDFIR